MAKITLQGIQKNYGSLTAIEHLDIDVPQGDFLVLLGPSGCGKTTTLNIMAGLETPSGGKTLFDGKDVTAVSPHERNVAMVFQSALLYPHLSARKNIETSLRRTAVAASERAARIATVSRMLEIEPLLDKLPSAMSGGQRQRVAIAKAIVREPSLLLLDEPLSALDASLRATLRAELVSLQKKLGVTAVLVTHDQVEAMTMGDRIAVMSNGRLEQIGTPDEIYGDPKTLFVARFLGTPPMNVLEGIIEDGQFVCDGFAMPVEGRPGKVSLAVRPQHVGISEQGLPVTVSGIENLGRETVVIAEAPDKSTIRLLVSPGSGTRLGDTFRVSFDARSAMLFNSAGRRQPAATIVS